jgi:hypothetical protein
VAIEVKLAAVEPPGGDWSMSRDFLQLRHYNDQLAVPGVLVDAHRVLLVEHGADQRYLDIMGRSASDGQMEAIRDHLLRSSNPRAGQLGSKSDPDAETRHSCLLW